MNFMRRGVWFLNEEGGNEVEEDEQVLRRVAMQ